ncbi:PRD domain-containing protein [Streptococcus sp. X16XC17]|uniref:PTS sugar transporter subunit IIA n=1 Tax=unclassified Streptococcus TaxID=2608887 RepID=UPI00066FC293|nr:MULTISPECIES: PTS sugar transporter subunit IIA [unclassified Streptococcus]TCD45838.1 PRD domain-containing protein [Streptococcus sp. X16XC17]
MAIINRWYRVLETLVLQHRVSFEEMRSDLNINSATLQKSIEQLNEVLDADLHIRFEQNQLVLEVYDYDRLEEILAGSLRKESDFNSSSKRSSYLIKRLIQSSSPLLIDDLAYEIGVSRTTINKDLKHVKDLAKQFNIEIKSHLKFLINRLIFHAQASDLFHGEIQSKYPLAFEMAKVAASVLEEKIGGRVESSELSYLALYFEMILRENKQDWSNKQRKIAVVCTTGRGTACWQLIRVLGQDIAVTQYSEEEFDPLDSDDYFAIFTTIPLKFSGRKSPVIQITNSFDDQWLQNEWQRVHRYHQKNLETLTAKYIGLSSENSYQANLEIMSRSLEKEGLVDKEFSRRILEREKKQSTNFGNGIGFPHTVNGQSSQTILMLGVVNQAQEIREEDVEFIFLVAIPQKVEQEVESDLLELYNDIFRIASDESLKEELRKIKTDSDLRMLSRNKGVF